MAVPERPAPPDVQLAIPLHAPSSVHIKEFGRWQARLLAWADMLPLADSATHLPGIQPTG